MRIIFKILIIIVVSTLLSNISAGQNGKHVLLIGLNGVSAETFQYAQTPNINALLKTGSISLKTRAVLPTLSAPNWSSHLTGAGPEETGVTNNNWLLNNYTIEPTTKDNDGHFPSIFNIIKQNNPQALTAMFYDWDWLGEFINLKFVDKAVMTSSYTETTDKATEYIKSNKPAFTFVFYGTPDEVGTIDGHLTIEYYLSIKKIDEEIAKLISALKDAGIFNETNIIIVSDHGGINKGQSGESMSEIEVPWIITGPGVVRNRVMQGSNDVTNTAPTIAYLLGITPPDFWIGKIVKEAFYKDNPDTTGYSYLPKPQCSLKPGVYFNKCDLNFSTSVNNVKVLYTLDGVDPNEKSPVYKTPIVLKTSAEIKAVCTDSVSQSEMTDIKVIVVEGVESIVLKDAPSDKYKANGAVTLLDGERGSKNFRDGKWLGFEGYNLTAIFYFGEDKKRVSEVSIGCLQDVKNLIFLPTEIEFYASNNGEDFNLVDNIKRADITGKNLDVRDLSKTFPNLNTRYLKVVVKNIKTVPVGNPSAGKKAWLFVDEIIIH